MFVFCLLHVFGYFLNCNKLYKHGFFVVITWFFVYYMLNSFYAGHGSIDGCGRPGCTGCGRPGCAGHQCT